MGDMPLPWNAFYLAPRAGKVISSSPTRSHVARFLMFMWTQKASPGSVVALLRGKISLDSDAVRKPRRFPYLDAPACRAAFQEGTNDLGNHHTAISNRFERWLQHASSGGG